MGEKTIHHGHTARGYRFTVDLHSGWTQAVPRLLMDRFPVLQVRVLATGERKRRGPIRAGHYVRLVFKPGWRTAVWVPLAQLADGHGLGLGVGGLGPDNLLQRDVDEIRVAADFWMESNQ